MRNTYNENHGGYVAHSIGSHKYLKREKINGKYRYWYYNVKNKDKNTSRSLDIEGRKRYNEAVKKIAEAEKAVESGKIYIPEKSTLNDWVHRPLYEEVYYDKENPGSQVARNVKIFEKGYKKNYPEDGRLKDATHYMRAYDDFKRRSEYHKQKEEEELNSIDTKIEFAKYTINKIADDTKKRGKKFLQGLIGRLRK